MCNCNPSQSVMPITKETVSVMYIESKLAPEQEVKAMKKIFKKWDKKKKGGKMS